MRKSLGWLATSVVTALTLVGGVILVQSLGSDPDRAQRSEAAAVVGLDLDDITLDLGALDKTAALASCATTAFIAGNPGAVEVLYGQRQVTATDPTGSFVLRNAAGKVMFCDMFGEERPAVLPLPTASASAPAVTLTNSRRDWSCAGPDGAQVARVRTNLWLAVHDGVQSARTRFWVQGVPGPWYGSARQGDYIHLQSWLSSVPATGALKLETEVLDGSGEAIDVAGIPSGPRSLMVSCGVEIG